MLLLMYFLWAPSFVRWSAFKFPLGTSSVCLKVSRAPSFVRWSAFKFPLGTSSASKFPGLLGEIWQDTYYDDTVCNPPTPHANSIIRFKNILTPCAFHQPHIPIPSSDWKIFWHPKSKLTLNQIKNLHRFMSLVILSCLAISTSILCQWAIFIYTIFFCSLWSLHLLQRSKVTGPMLCYPWPAF